MLAKELKLTYNNAVKQEEIMTKETCYKFIKTIFTYASLVFVIGLAAWIIRDFCMIDVVIQGQEMTPTIDEGTTGVTFLWHEDFQRGDLVLIKQPGGQGYAIRRIIALPNETVSCVDEVIYVNGEPLDEDYLDADYVKKMQRRYGYFTRDFNEVELWTNEYFLLGDNRIAAQETDSRALGAYTENSLKGKNLILLSPNFEVIK